jgi:hypothetical protein
MGFSFLHIYFVAKSTGNDDIRENFLYVPLVASSNDDLISPTFDSHVSCACNSLVLQWSLLVRCFRLRKAASTSLYPKNLVSRASPHCFCSPEGCWGQVELGVLVRFPIQNMYPTAISRRGSDYGAACHGQPNGKFYSRQPSPKTPGLEPNAA